MSAKAAVISTFLLAGLNCAYAQTPLSTSPTATPNPAAVVVGSPAPDAAGQVQPVGSMQSSLATAVPSPVTSNKAAEPSELDRKSSALQAIAATRLVDNRISEADQAALDKAYLFVKDLCTKTLTSLSGDAKERAQYSIWVAITGAVAGSVIAPSLLAGGGSKVAASMFSGLSGAANTAQQVVSDQGVTAQSSRASREKVLSAVRTALNDYSVALADTSASAEVRLAKMKAALFKADMECFLRPE